MALASLLLLLLWTQHFGLFIATKDLSYCQWKEKGRNITLQYTAKACQWNITTPSNEYLVIFANQSKDTVVNQYHSCLYFLYHGVDQFNFNWKNQTNQPTWCFLRDVVVVYKPHDCNKPNELPYFSFYKKPDGEELCYGEEAFRFDCVDYRIKKSPIQSTNCSIGQERPHPLNTSAMYLSTSPGIIVAAVAGSCLVGVMFLGIKYMVRCGNQSYFNFSRFRNSSRAISENNSYVEAPTVSMQDNAAYGFLPRRGNLTMCQADREDSRSSAQYKGDTRSSLQVGQTCQENLANMAAQLKSEGSRSRESTQFKAPAVMEISKGNGQEDETASGAGWAACAPAPTESFRGSSQEDEGNQGSDEGAYMIHPGMAPPVKNKDQNSTALESIYMKLNEDSRESEYMPMYTPMNHGK